MSHILVVSQDQHGLTQTLGVLRRAGYYACGATTFEDATELLMRKLPDLVMADECLGEYNGLHVILRARHRDPAIAGIVTSPSVSRGLEADARNLNVGCVAVPQDPPALLMSICKALPHADLRASTLHAKRAS